MIGRVLALVLLAAMVRVAPAAAQTDVPPGEDFHVEFGVIWWWPSPELAVQTGQFAAAGIDQVDLASEFGIGSQRFSDFRVVLRPGRKHKFRVGYVPVRYEQSAQLQRRINFGGTVFSGTASTDIRWDLWRFGYQWDMIARDRGSFGIIGEIKYNKVRASLRSSGRGEVADARAPIPTLGVAGRGYVHRNVSITGELTAFKFSGGDFDGTFFDVDVSATASLSRHFGVQGGYRAVTADYLVDDDTGDLKLRGIYFGLLSRF
jgi:hypothetical protein